MKSSYQIRTNNGKVYYQEKELDFKQDVYEEQQEDFHKDFISCKYKETFLNNVVLITRDGSIKPPVVFDLQYNASYIKVQFELEGSNHYRPNTADGLEVRVGKNEFNFFYFPKVDGSLTFSSPRKKSLEIVVNESYLRTLFKSGFEQISGRLGQALEKQVPFKLFEQSKAIPPNLMLIINEIINCTYQAEIKEVYIESKVKEIFSYLFSLLHADAHQKDDLKLSAQERNKITQIEQLLKDKLRSPFTIKQLAIISGMNETTLKRNFKRVTGKPIFSYLTDMRMEKAKELLMHNEKNVSEVAYAVGYKNPQHFTSAFKRKFNYVPSELKNVGQFNAV